MKRGKAITISLVILNGGNAKANNVKACLKLDKKAKKALKIKGKACRTIGGVAAGQSKKAKIKVSAKKKAKKKAYTVTSSVKGSGLPKGTRPFKIKVR